MAWGLKVQWPVGSAVGGWYLRAWPAWAQSPPLLGVCPYLQNGDNSGDRSLLSPESTSFIFWLYYSVLQRKEISFSKLSPLFQFKSGVLHPHFLDISLIPLSFLLPQSHHSQRDSLEQSIGLFIGIKNSHSTLSMTLALFKFFKMEIYIVFLFIKEIKAHKKWNNTEIKTESSPEFLLCIYK